MSDHGEEGAEEGASAAEGPGNLQQSLRLDRRGTLEGNGVC